MRLIDADPLLKKTHNYYPSIDHYCCSRKVVELRDIIEAPTIEAEPVKHGRWIAVPSSDMVTGKAYECSECRKMRFGSFKPNYCPNCGAKMDLED